MRGGMLSEARPLNPAQAHMPASMPSNKDLIIRVVGTHRYEASTIISNCISYSSSSSSFQGGPLDRANQAGQWSPLQPSEFQFRWNWGARWDLHVNYSPLAFLPIMAACPPTSHQSLELGATSRSSWVEMAKA